MINPGILLGNFGFACEVGVDLSLVLAVSFRVGEARWGMGLAVGWTGTTGQRCTVRGGVHVETSLSWSAAQLDSGEGVWGRVAGTAATRDSWGLVGCRNAAGGVEDCPKDGRE